MSIKDRKKDHIDLTVNQNSQYDINTGFDDYYMNHNALPEVNFEEVSLSAKLLGRTFSMPLFISSMTGGHKDSVTYNEIIAEVCEDFDLPFGVGSQRAMLLDKSLIPTFRIARTKAPNAFIAANIGGVQLIGGMNKINIRSLVESIEADAVIVHLNPLQELIQPEGDRDFKGVLAGIEDLIKKTDVPVIVKETGAGISAYVAKKLLNAGVSVIDVAGAGGTSWAKVENQRQDDISKYAIFDNWGIPTSICIEELARLNWERSFQIIASGGIRTSSDIIKSLCLGAHFTATAQPVIQAIHEKGYKGLEYFLNNLKDELRIHLTLLGCLKPEQLNRTHLRTHKH